MPQNAVKTDNVSTIHPQQDDFTPARPTGRKPHTVENQPKGLVNYNLYGSDIALQEAVEAHYGAWGGKPDALWRYPRQ